MSPPPPLSTSVYSLLFVAHEEKKSGRAWTQFVPPLSSGTQLVLRPFQLSIPRWPQGTEPYYFQIPVRRSSGAEVAAASLPRLSRRDFAMPPSGFHTTVSFDSSPFRVCAPASLASPGVTAVFQLVVYLALTWRPLVVDARPSPSGVALRVPPTAWSFSSRSRKLRRGRRVRSDSMEDASSTDVSLWLKLMADAASSSSPSAPGFPPKERRLRNTHDRRRPRNISPSIHGRILRRRQLYSRTGFHLQIHPDGTVNGTRKDHSTFGILEFMPLMVGVQTIGPCIAIRSVESRRYLCMDKRGKLYGSKEKSDECEFKQTMEHNYYETWWSCKYPSKNGKKLKKNKKYSKKKWYIALDRQGHQRSGRKSRHTQKFTHFLARPVDHTKVPYLFKKQNVFFSGSPTTLPHIENRIALPEGDEEMSVEDSSVSSSSFPSRKNSDADSSVDAPAVTATSLNSKNTVEPNARRPVPRGRARAGVRRQKFNRRGKQRRPKARKYGRRRQLLHKRLEKRLLQKERQQVSQQLSKVFALQNP